MTQQVRSGRSRSDLLGRCVLLIEDDFHEARDTQQALQHAGARVLGPFSSSSDALRAIATQNASCAILDLNLQDGVRFQVAAALKDKGIPFLVVTGLSNVEMPEDLASSPVLQKPVEYRHLLQLTAELSRHRYC